MTSTSSVDRLCWQARWQARWQAGWLVCWLATAVLCAGLAGCGDDTIKGDVMGDVVEDLGDTGTPVDTHVSDTRTPDTADPRDGADASDTQTDIDTEIDTGPLGPRCGTTACAVGRSCCDYACVDLQLDAGNCGGCGLSCAAGETCDAGACRCGTDACTTGEECCALPGAPLQCVSPANDVHHCGACGNICPLSERCLGGQCLCLDANFALEACSDGQICCDGSGCIDLDNDPNNCGQCGAVCGSGELCVQGVCACGTQTGTTTIAACAPGTACCGDPASCQPQLDCACGSTLCGAGGTCCDLDDGTGATHQECVPVWRDAEHCGTCGVACGPGERCLGGSCSCFEGLASCDANPTTGCETRLSTDREHCGGCGAACPPGEVCGGAAECGLECGMGLVKCDDVCTLLDSDRLHCGTCANACGPGMVCDGEGQCDVQCQPGKTECGGWCVDLNANRLHCGTCGNGCAAGEVCNGEGQCALTCQVGFTNCGGTCVDLTTDDRNCGTCAAPCADGAACQGGACVPNCSAGLRECGGQCVDVQDNRAHCGDCFQGCAPGLDCFDGACGVDCAPFGLTGCGELCVDLLGDSNHCGGCDVRCAAGESCKGGVCGLFCQDYGLAECAGACVDVLTDADHCGICDSVCGTPQYCAGGVCSLHCGAGLSECTDTCADTTNDPSHCGGCDTPCTTPEFCQGSTCGLHCGSTLTACDGACVDTDSDPTHCGGCGQPCAAPEFCQGGVCSAHCAAGQTPCNQVCVNTDSDPANCGGCGQPCATPEFCQGGQCGLHCGSGLTECDARCVDTNTDPAHCGLCGSACALPGYCAGGSCGLHCDSFGLVECGGACVDTASDATHCGACGTVCSSLEQCVVGTCALVCDVHGLVECDGACVDVENDPAHCGDCTTACAPTEFCEFGACTDSCTTCNAYEDVVANGMHSCGIYRDSTGTTQVLCWGLNNDGQLGYGVLGVESPTPQVVDLSALQGVGPDWLDSLNFVQVVAGTAHTCVLTDLGEVACWGRNNDGQLGDGTVTGGVVPRVVKFASPVFITELTAGIAHTCGLDDQRQSWCWGDNVYGQLGDGTTADRSLPVKTLAPLDGLSIAAGGRHTCQVRLSGELVCWGRNAQGQIGQPGSIGLTPFYKTPRLVPPFNFPLMVTAVSAGLAHTCALVEDISITSSTDPDRWQVYCWGDTTFGQVPGVPVLPTDKSLCIYDKGCPLDWLQHDGNTDSATRIPSGRLPSAPVAPLELDAGAAHTCVRFSNLEVWCWGANARGQLGTTCATLFDCDATSTDWPVKVVGLADATAISAGAASEMDEGAYSMIWPVDHTCALRASGDVTCWGANHAGQAGTGAVALPDPRVVPGLADATAISTHDALVCAKRAAGPLHCWGQHWPGDPHVTQGYGGSIDSEYYASVRLHTADTRAGVPAATATAIAVGKDFTCGAEASGAVSCWGGCAYGKVGYDCSSLYPATSWDFPRPVVGLDGSVPATSAVALAAGDAQACAILEDDTVSCWGNTDVTRRSDNTYQSQGDLAALVTVSGTGANLTAVGLSIGYRHACAVVADGSVRCWGEGDDGKLGAGGGVDSNAALLVAGVSGATQVAVGDKHSCALVPGGVKCWGDNTYGQLGDGTNQPVVGLADVVFSGGFVPTTIAAGRFHTCALDAAGDAQCWGYNEDGRLANGTTANAFAPTASATGFGLVALSCGTFHCCGFDAGGQATCWGEGRWGSLGDGVSVLYDTPGPAVASP